MKNCFVEVSIPPRHRRDAVAHLVHWYSWSPETIRLIKSNLGHILTLPPPRRISVRGCAPYSDTYTYHLSRLPRPAADFALAVAIALLRTRVGHNLKLFTGMLDPPLTSSVLHKCFALIRAGIVRLTSDPRAALHAPLHPERLDDGFPLHSDLFLTERLWVIFDNVSNGKSGKSLFLPRRSFEDAIRSNPLMPAVTKRKLRALFRDRMDRDSFDESFETIYDSDQPWTAPLVQSMKDGRWSIKLFRGEGYLLNDRQWLHGRTAVNGPVRLARFRRLVYGTVATGK